jgi:hypothetical protein
MVGAEVGGFSGGLVFFMRRESSMRSFNPLLPPGSGWTARFKMFDIE